MSPGTSPAGQGNRLPHQTRRMFDAHGGHAEGLLSIGVGNRGNRFAVASDGRFLTNEPIQSGPPDSPQLTVVLNWASEIKEP